MKLKQFAALAVAALTGAGAWAMPEGWTDDLDAAKAQAAKEGKLVLVDFSGSDWCCWCQRLDEEVFAKKEFIDEAKKDFVLVLVDSPSNTSKLSEKAKNQNPKLVEEFGIRGFPTVLILDAQGQKLAQTGYRRGGPKPYLEKLAEIKKAVDSGEDLAAKEREREAAAKKAASDRKAAAAAYMAKHWTDDFDAAKAKAAKEGKSLLMYFGGPEDRWSQELEEKVFSKRDFVEAAEKDYVLVQVVVPQKGTKLPKKVRKQNEKLVKRFNAGIWLPIVMVLDADGKEIARETSAAPGSASPKEYLASIEKMKAAGFAVKAFEESVGDLEKGSSERIAKIDELIQKIGEKEADKREDVGHFVQELLENDKDGKFAAKYPHLGFVEPARKRYFELVHIRISTTLSQCKALGYDDNAWWKNSAITEKDHEKIKKAVAAAVLEKLPGARKAIEDIKAAAPESVHGEIDEILKDVKELEDRL